MRQLLKDALQASMHNTDKDDMALPTSPWFVAIGASGEQGLHDVIDLLSALPPAPASVLMVVLHRPSDQGSRLLTVLQRQCAFPVAVATQAQCLEPGHCYIGEPAEHLTLMSRGRADLVNGEGHTFRKQNGRPPVRVGCPDCRRKSHRHHRVRGIK